MYVCEPEEMYESCHTVTGSHLLMIRGNERIDVDLGIVGTGCCLALSLNIFEFITLLHRA